MLKNTHNDGKTLISQMEALLDDMHRYSKTVDRYVITSSTDTEGVITSVSQAFCDITGYHENELIGKKHSMLRHPDSEQKTFKELWQTIKAGQSWNGELCNLKKNGDCYWANLHIDSIIDRNGEIVGFVAIYQDITDRKKIEKLNLTDELTGAFNRRHYNNVLPNEIHRAQRDQKYLCLLMLDADNFKSYNDTYGHQAGDEVLVEIVKTLTDNFKRADDFVFRLGGEEFAVVYRSQDIEHAETIADKARINLLDKRIPHSGNSPVNKVSVSLGLMILDPLQNYIHDEVYKYADAALYRAKEAGRNRLEIHGNEDDIELFD